MAPAQSPPELLRATSRSSAASERFSFEDDESLDFEAKQEDAGPRARILDLAGLEQEQNRLIAEAVECTGVSEDEAVLLLRFCHWDVAAFNEAFFEDAAALRGAAGVSEAQDVPMSPRACGICFCEPGKALMACPEAHPLFCETCWRQYLDHAVHDGKGCLDLRCPAPGCQEMVRPSLFDQLLSEGRQRYRRFLTESLVDASKGRLRWCPGQNCCCAASETPEVQCFCGCGWCFFCGNDLHAPVACDTVKSWEEKNRDEGCDAVWIKVNTKLCPKCGNPIEKNGGCMHMTCRKPGGCGHEFCWICLKDWQNHQQCNAADDDLVNRSKAASKHELLRYAHYFERYLAHHKAEKFAAAGQRQALEAVAEQFIKSLGVTVQDVDFVHLAREQVRSSRRFLKWTYAHGYFMKCDDSQKKLFEFHQAQLEGTLERLSDVLENTPWGSYMGDEVLSNQPFYDLRAKVIGLTGVVRDFFAKLQEAMQQGTLNKA